MLMLVAATVAFVGAQAETPATRAEQLILCVGASVVAESRVNRHPYDHPTRARLEIASRIHTPIRQTIAEAFEAAGLDTDSFGGRVEKIHSQMSARDDAVVASVVEECARDLGVSDAPVSPPVTIAEHTLIGDDTHNIYFVQQQPGQVFLLAVQRGRYPPFTYQSAILVAGVRPTGQSGPSTFRATRWAFEFHCGSRRMRELATQVLDASGGIVDGQLGSGEWEAVSPGSLSDNAYRVACDLPGERMLLRTIDDALQVWSATPETVQ